MTKPDPVMWSQAWVNCPCPISVDVWSGCNFACEYCFMTYKQRNWWSSEVKPLSYQRIKSLLTREGLKRDTGQWQKFKWAWENITYTMSTRTDPFPYLEKTLKATYKAMKLFEGKHLSVLTKNPAYLTDEYLDLGINLAVSTSLSAPDTCLEKNAPSVESRLNGLKHIHSKGIPIGLRLTPTFPYLWTESSLQRVLELEYYVVVIDHRWYKQDLKGHDIDDLKKGADFMAEIARKEGHKVHFIELEHRCLGEPSCVPKNFPVWQGTYFEKTPKLPKEAAIYPRNLEWRSKLLEEGKNYAHFNPILHEFDLRRKELTGYDENWDSEDNKYENDETKIYY